MADLQIPFCAALARGSTRSAGLQRNGRQYGGAHAKIRPCRLLRRSLVRISACMAAATSDAWTV